MEFKIRGAKLSHVLLILVCVIFAAGYLFYIWNKSLNEISNEALDITKVAEAAFPKDSIAKMDLNVSDLEKPDYQQIKNNLISLRQTTSQIRFAYILVEQKGKLYIVADSEPVDSKDYSPPGQEFTEASPEDFVPFSTRQPYVTGPVQDRWGIWVSVLAPIFDSRGAMVGVFGMDYPAERWNDKAYSNLAKASVTVLFLLVIIIAFFVISNQNSEIRANEKNFKNFFGTVDDFAVVTDKLGYIIFANKAVPKKLGYLDKDIIGQQVYKFCPVDQLKNVQKCFKEIVAGKRDSCSVTFSRKDGSRIQFETRAWAGKWNGEDVFFSISKDLTTEMALLQKFNVIFESSPTPMALTDSSKKFSDVNQAFLDALGYKKEEVIGKTAKSLNIILEFEQQVDMKDGMLPGMSFKNVEVKMKNKSGETRYGLFSGELIEILGKQYMLTVMVDQTERKEIEQEIMQKNQQLEELNKVFINRELKMVELKNEIEQLKSLNKASGGKS